MISRLVFAILFIFLFHLPALSKNNHHNSSFRLRENMHYVEPWGPEDVKAEIILGKKVASQILANYPMIQNKKIQRYINLLGQGIATIHGRNDINYYFAVLDSDHKNAYATPGGYIFITRGLLEACNNESELVGILAHEISHVNRRYIIKKYNVRGIKSDLVSLSTIVAAGSSQTARLSLTMLADAITDELLNKGLDKQEELDADLDAIYMMKDLGYSASAYKDFLVNFSTEIKRLNYIVKLGDSLSLISKAFYGDLNKWPIIYQDNKHKIKDPDLIYPNQQFSIPMKQPLQQLVSNLQNKGSRSMSSTHPSNELRVSIIDSALKTFDQKMNWIKKERFDAITTK